LSSRTSDTPAVRLSRHLEHGDWDGVVAVLDRSWSEVLSADPALVRSVLTRMPADVVSQNPRWAAGRQYFDRMSSDPHTTVHFRDARSAPPSSLLDVLARLTAQAASARSAGGMATATASAREARELFDEATPAAQRELGVAIPELAYQWAMVWEFAGDVDAAVREYTNAYDYAKITDNVATEALAASSIAWMHALAGRNRLAATWLAKAPPTEGHPWHDRASAGAALTKGMIALDRLDFVDARATLAALTPQTTGERWPARQLLAAYALESTSELLALQVEVESWGRENFTHLREAGLVRSLHAMTRSRLLVATGGRPPRLPLVEEVEPAGSLGRGLIDATRAAAAAHGGDYRSAARLAAALRITHTAIPRVLVTAMGLSAASLLRDTAAASAVDAFRLVTDLATDEGLFFSLTSIPRHDLDELLAQAAHALPADIADRLRQLAADPASDPFRTLSRTEERVLKHLLTDKGTADIAAALVVSPNTIKTHVRKVYQKLGVTSRDELRSLAQQSGYLGDG
jgi:LuxR family maltose regulon positive regulatory protein